MIVARRLVVCAAIGDRDQRSDTEFIVCANARVDRRSAGQKQVLQPRGPRGVLHHVDALARSTQYLRALQTCECLVFTDALVRSANRLEVDAGCRLHG